MIQNPYTRKNNGSDIAKQNRWQTLIKGRQKLNTTIKLALTNKREEEKNATKVTMADEFEVKNRYTSNKIIFYSKRQTPSISMRS